MTNRTLAESKIETQRRLAIGIGMIMNQMIFGLACWISFMPIANAQFGIGSGNSWMVFCERYKQGKNAADEMCELYTQGVVEGWIYGYGKAKHDALGADGATSSKPFCLSASHSTEQHVYVIKQYMEKYPSLRHLPAALLIADAMADAFPCTNK